jgi:hypothetical protein
MSKTQITWFFGSVNDGLAVIASICNRMANTGGEKGRGVLARARFSLQLSIVVFCEVVEELLLRVCLLAIQWHLTMGTSHQFFTQGNLKKAQLVPGCD